MSNTQNLYQFIENNFNNDQIFDIDQFHNIIVNDSIINECGGIWFEWLSQLPIISSNELMNRKTYNSELKTEIKKQQQKYHKNLTYYRTDLKASEKPNPITNQDLIQIINETINFN